MTKKCPSCGARYEGEGVDRAYSCEACGYPTLNTVEDRSKEDPNYRLPHAGGQTVTHSRDNF